MSPATITARPARRATRMAVSVPFSGETRPAISATGTTATPSVNVRAGGSSRDRGRLARGPSGRRATREPSPLVLQSLPARVGERRAGRHLPFVAYARFTLEPFSPSSGRHSRPTGVSATQWPNLRATGRAARQTSLGLARALAPRTLSHSVSDRPAPRKATERVAAGRPPRRRW